MSRPAFLKLGGSVLTDKQQESTLRRAVARRLMGEISKSEIPLVLFHGAGSYGHPQAERWHLGTKPVTSERRAGVAETMASVMQLHAEVLQMANEVGLKPVSVPLHFDVTSESGMLEGIPVGRIEELLAEGFTPVMHGTLVRDDSLGWRVVSADELMAELAADLQPRLALFVTNVDGVLGPEGVIPNISDVSQVADYGRKGADVTGTMAGKIRHALSVAETCPTLIVNGESRGRVLDALRGKAVICTRVDPNRLT